MRPSFSLLTCLTASLSLTMGCAVDTEPDLRFVAHGTEPGWTIYFWSDSLSLGMEGDHSAHTFPSPPITTDGTTLETMAGESSLRLVFEEEPCVDPRQTGMIVTLSLGDQRYSGCRREPTTAFVRARGPGGVFSTAAPRDWSRASETRGDTSAVTWRAGAAGGAEFTAMAVPVTGGFDQDGLIALAESFARARYSHLTPEPDLMLAPSPGAIRVTFTSPADAEVGRARLVVDIAQEPGRLRLLSLFTEPDDEVRPEESVLLGGFRWLRPAPAPVPPAQAPA